jgi:hypothetical protein
MFIRWLPAVSQCLSAWASKEYPALSEVGMESSIGRNSIYTSLRLAGITFCKELKWEEYSCNNEIPFATTRSDDIPNLQLHLQDALVSSVTQWTSEYLNGKLRYAKESSQADLVSSMKK